MTPPSRPAPDTIGLFEAMYTQRAVRYIRPDPIPDALLRRVLDAGIRAPSGGNQQRWRFVVIKDAETKRWIQERYRDTARPAHAPPRDEAEARTMARNDAAAEHLAQHLHEVPVLILCCVEHDGSPGDLQRGASIYPAVQNMLLAARGLGLASVLTTRPRRGFEKEIKQRLGIPDNVDTAALLPLGYPADGRRYGPTNRRPVDEVTFSETWGTRLPPSPTVPSREEILERARAMVPTLRARALVADQNRGIPVETHREFAAAGFYRLFQPARYGGSEMPLGMMVEVAGELGRGCGSSAWIFTNLAVQSWIIGMHQPTAQDDVWGADPGGLAASSFPVKGGTGRRVDGGLVLNGTWSFASGIDFADWENLQVFIPKESGPPDHRFVLVPKRDFRVEDDWFVTGLSGTASKSVVLEDVFVPQHRVLDTQSIMGGPSPGSAVNPNPLYRVPPWSVGTKVFSGPALGIARGALDLIEEEMSGRHSVGGVRMAEIPTVQARIAEAGAEIDAARAVLLADCDEAMRIAASGERPSLAQRARWRRNNAFAGQLCLRAVERLHPLVGARGLERDSLFQLAWRDIHAAVSQITMAWDIQAVNAGRIQFGLPSLDPRL